MSVRTAEAQRQRIKTLRDQGLSLRRIAHEVGCSHEQVRRILNAPELAVVTDSADPPRVITPIVSDGRAGRQLVEALENAILDDDGETVVGSYTARDRALIEQAAEVADQIQTLGAILAAEGLVVVTSTGNVRTHPALVEQRQLRGRLTAILRAIQPATDDDAADGEDITSMKARRAANVRWSRDRRRRARRHVQGVITELAERGWSS